jgi:lactate dehydrogenase-like 2-hydroxyacid dehydrogenase
MEETFEDRGRKDIRVLLTREMDPYVERSLDASYTMHKIFNEAERLAFLQAHGGEIDAVVTTGLVGLKANEIALLPNVKVIHAFAVGYESVDLDAAFARNIYVSHGAGNNSFCVAEHGLALMLAMTRRILVGDRQARQGVWHAADPRPVIFRKNLGILGLGSIGLELAKRVAAFDMQVGYHNRRPRHAHWRYFDRLVDLAQWADYLFVACPGGKATFHAVDADVLKALGPNGYLINVSRGSVVDTRALVDALNTSAIAGAGVDVLEGEPDVPSWVFDAPNLLLSPHIAGQSPETAIRKFELIRDNVEACIDGGAPVTPVAEWVERFGAPA